MEGSNLRTSRLECFDLQSAQCCFTLPQVSDEKLLKTKHKIDGFMVTCMEYYREEIFKGRQGSVFLIHHRCAANIRLQRKQRRQLVFVC